MKLIKMMLIKMMHEKWHLACLWEKVSYPGLRGAERTALIIRVRAEVLSCPRGLVSAGQESIFALEVIA